MLYKFYGASSGSEALKLLKYVCKDATIRASDPRSFNDPFEIKVAFDFDADDEVIRARYFADNPSSSDADYAEWRKGFTGNFKSHYSQTARTTMLSSCGVICLTLSEENHLLWSHYAANHQGFCIGFDDAIVERLPGVLGHGPVTYQRKAPVFRFYRDPPEIFPRSAFFYKSDCWSYEQEYRVVTDEQQIIQFPKTCLREVILGCRAYPDLRRYAQREINDVEFRFFQMVEIPDEFSLKKSPIQQGRFIMSSHF